MVRKGEGTWNEIDARPTRGDNDTVRLLWQRGSDLFKVIFEGVETPPMTYEEAREDFYHPSVSRYIGSVASESILGLTPVAELAST